MKVSRRLMMRWTCAALGVLLLAGIVAPFVHADRFKGQIHAALERAIHRKVEFEDVRFNLLTGPGFSIDKVVIHEDPAIGIEPVAYVSTLRAGIRFWSLWTGRLEFNSVVLEEASINVAKTDQGRWNFEALLGRASLAGVPSISVRSGRINFRFGELKSRFYLMNANADLRPPGLAGRSWEIGFEGQPSRSDRVARGFGHLSGNGRWSVGGDTLGRLDMNVSLDDNALADVSSLVYGYDAGVHGELSARIRLSGPLDQIGVGGTLEVRDVHRWDLMPAGESRWRFRLKGQLNVLAQQVELEATSAVSGHLPLTVRLRASDYLATPRWAASMTWARFPVEPLLVLARHMGVPAPEGLELGGWIEGAINYSGETGLQGELGFQETTLAIPDSARLRFEQARLVVDGPKVELLPSAVLTDRDELATLAGSWDARTGAVEIGISTSMMQVGALRAQARLAAIPWLEQFESGQWSGALSYRHDGNSGSWTGRLRLAEAIVRLPGVGKPLVIQRANARIAGERVMVDGMRISAGNLAASGEYRYEPGVARPHRFRLAFDDLDAGELEDLLMPTLRRGGNLLVRAFRIGRVPVPDWLRTRRMEGLLQVRRLGLGGFQLERVESPVVWDGTGIVFPRLRARLGKAQASVALVADIRGAWPVYRLKGRWHGLDWQSGLVSGGVGLETRGTGAELLGNLRASGEFDAQAPDFEALPAVKSAHGSYEVTWNGSGANVRLDPLQLDCDGDTYNGRGFTTDEGRLVVLLTSGVRELRMSGTLANLRMDETAAR